MANVIHSKGNGTTAVHGYNHKIVVYKSTDGGQNWKEIAKIKAYGSKSKVNEAFAAFNN